MQKFPITTEGFKQISSELKTLKTAERPAIIKAIAEAREHGDLSENAEYHAAREKQSFIEGRIASLEDKIARSEIIDISKLSGNTVKFGATVKLIDIDADHKNTYKIVGEYEADLEKGMVSIASPIARALIGKNKGDFIEVNTPTGIKEYEILGIEYK
jgi:transcription elongation factor GreA